MALVPAVIMLRVCAFLQQNAPLRAEIISATPAPTPPTISNAAPRPHAVVAVIAGGHRNAPVARWSINVLVRQISSAVSPNLPAAGREGAGREGPGRERPGRERLGLIPRRHFHWLENARREQWMAHGRLSMPTKVPSVRFSVPGIAVTVRKKAITATAWPRI